MRYQIDAPVTTHVQLNEHEYELTLYAPGIARDAEPGQFVQLLCGTTHVPFHRRPFSVFRTNPDAGTFGIIYLTRGSFTRRLTAQKPGDVVSVVGPLGNRFRPDGDPDALHYLVAGGVGAPPLYFLAQEMAACGTGDRVTVINGARTRSLLVAEKEFADLGVGVTFTTDDGTLGQQGLVTDALAPMLDHAGARARVYTCGPTPMLRAVAEVCLSRGAPCQVSVETLMPCGVGVCMGCVVKIRDASVPEGYVYKRSCFDGPVFGADEVVWE